MVSEHNSVLEPDNDPSEQAQEPAAPFTGGHMTPEELAYLAGHEVEPPANAMPDHSGVSAVPAGLTVRVLESKLNPETEIKLEQLPRFFLAIGGDSAQVLTMQVFTSEPDSDLEEAPIDNLVVRLA